LSRHHKNSFSAFRGPAIAHHLDAATPGELDCMGNKQQADFAKNHLAQMDPESRAILERDWDDR